MESAARHGTGTVAWIEVCTDAASRPGLGPLVAGYTLRQIGRCVRADDRVCPLGASSVVVEFGPVADVVPLEVLGDRLARALGPSLPFCDVATGLTVSVGMAAPIDGDGPDRVTRRARSAARSSARSLGAGRRTTTAVTVDDPLAGPAADPVHHGTHLGLHVRSVRRYGVGHVDGIPTLLAHDGPSGATATGGTQRSSSLTVLVVDPMTADGAEAGLAAQAAVTVARRLGCRAGADVVPPDGPPPTTVDGDEVDLVVLVLDGAWAGRSPDWATGAWGLPARLTTDYADKGIPVLAVGAGAGAGAMAACVSQGALALFSLDGLSDALCSLDGLSVDEARQVAELGFPNRFLALLELTAGERRILFYLTEGWAAQDIADELVVSLTTVRSHIRSVLRKLEVRSQLAAVAIANSRDLDHHQVTPHS